MRIEAPHFVAGLILKDGHVEEAAPIIRYMTGKSQVWVLNYCRVKGWKVS